MAIVKMKKLRVMAMASDRDALLRRLLHLGCVEIREPGNMIADPEWAALLRRSTSRLTEAKAQVADVAAALAALRRYAPVKAGMFTPRDEVTEKDFLSSAAAGRAKAAAAGINALLQELTALQNEEGRLTAKEAALNPWRPLDLPLDCSGTAHMSCRLGVCPAAVDIAALRLELGGSDIAAELLEISADRQQHYLLLLCYRADESAAMDLLRPHGFSATAFPGIHGTAAENVDALSREKSQNLARQADITQKLKEFGDDRPALQRYADLLSTEASEAASAERLLTDDTVIFFEGWAPAESAPKVEKLLAAHDCAYEFSDPASEEYPAVPIKLKNNRFTRPLNMVTEMYSLPAYDGLDPNPLMAPFFILFYGIMMADMGYGILMVLLGALIVKKAKPKGTSRNLAELMELCGITTFIMGALTGGFFGDFLPQIVKIINPNTTFTSLPYLFTPLNDTMAILIGALALGFVQVVTGMAISFIKKIRDGEVFDAIFSEGTWWVIYAGAALAVLKIGNIGGVPVVLAVGVVMLMIGSGHGKKGFSKVGSFLGAVYNGATGIFSDVMSYSRLMALMLSGSIIATVFNSLGAITGNVVGFVLISMIGNALNFALNILGCYVHDLRLQCLEFFGKFYKDGGKPFRPLAYQTKYVDIKEEN